MLKPSLPLLCAAVLSFPIGATGAGGNTYKSFSTDQGGRLRINFTSGQEELAPMVRGQVGFANPLLSPDGGTAGWLALYPYPRVNQTDYDPGPLAGSLILYRNGRILHNFTTEQTFWDWHFWRNGNEVAYSVGPTHGGAAELLLCDVKTAKVLVRWVPRAASPPE